MKSLLCIFSFFLFLSCRDNTENIKVIAKDSLKTKEKQNRRWDTLYISSYKEVYVLGDSTTKQIDYVSTKFEPHILFSDFPAHINSQRKQATINWNSNIEAKEFKTRITETYKNKGVNFAGHYCFVDWGCGSPCQSSVVIDVLTGKIYDGISASLGYDFKTDSRMIIVNPPDSTGYFLDCAYCKPIIYIWDENTKKFVER